MNDTGGPVITGNWIVAHRGRKNVTDQLKPYAWLVENERSAKGEIVQMGTVFLTNMECPFNCLMCDLWRNTTDHPVETGSIPAQIEWALKKFPEGLKHIKLYNSGSFFDHRAVNPGDYKEIAGLVRGYSDLIVESHPAFIGENCLRFRDLIKPDLQIAIGLETADNSMLKRLNKSMTTEDFARSVSFLNHNGISVRAFVLLRPPFLDEEEGIELAERSIDFAFDSGAECCVVIPVRGGNGAMDILKERGLFSPPEISSLEKVLEYGIGLNRGRVFADTWDLALFSKCNICSDERIRRITQMNLNQEFLDPVKCSCYTL